MKIVCPYCLKKFGVEEGARSEAMLELAETGNRLKMPWALILEYVDCFRRTNEGYVTTPKRLRIFKEIAKFTERCIFEYDGKRYKTTIFDIQNAIRIICDAGKYGFTNHNYLKKILLETAERVSAEGLTAKEEKGLEIEKRKEKLANWDGKEEVQDIGDIRLSLGVGSMKELVRQKAGEAQIKK